MGVVLGNDTFQVEWSGFHTEEKHMRPVGDSTMESRWKGGEGYR